MSEKTYQGGVVLDIDRLVRKHGSVMTVARSLGVGRNTLYRWIEDNSVPAIHAANVAALWEVPHWIIHDPFAGTKKALRKIYSLEEAEIKATEAVAGTGKAGPKEKPKPPPMVRADGQPQPGWRFTYRPKTVNQWNTVTTVKVARGARWVEGFPAEGISGFPSRFTWLDGREIGLADNGSGTLIYVEVDTGHPFGDSKPAIRTAHAAIRAMATRGVHDRVEAKWEGDWDDMEGVDGAD